MTDCSSIHGSTTSSSDIISSSRGCLTNPRIRIVRMIRPNSRRMAIGPECNSTFGFAIRGGKEFGTGFFVSNVEKGSEADVKGLRIGDQIIRANGYNVDDAVHKELTQLISSQDRLTLKVRGVGMLPVKEKTIDPLSWHIVPQRTLTSLTCLEEVHQIPQKDVRIVLKIASPRTKLGLGICKGPEWKPGIFVQFTKEFSVARNAGLRPGDQILSCNSIDFSDVLFSEAVAVMKSAPILEMIVRTGAGSDLFPGESSGYNSSASSITGDQSPCWADQSSKRLSSVREENTLNKFGTYQPKYWQHHQDWNTLGRRKDFLCTTSSSDSSSTTNEFDGNKTVIQLSENGTLINNTLISNANNNKLLATLNRQQNKSSSLSSASTISSISSTSSSLGVGDISGNGNVKLNFITPEHVPSTNNMMINYSNSNCNSNNNNSSASCNNNINNATNNSALISNKVGGKIADICFVSRQSETKTVIVEVHRSAATDDTTKTTNISSSSPASTSSSSSLLPSSPLPSGVNAPVPPPKPPPPSTNITNDTNNSERSSSVASSYGASSLSSAISEELKKRQERKSTNQVTNQNEFSNKNQSDTAESQSRQQPLKKFGNSLLGGCSDDKERHNALMDEFKRAHRKMFKNGYQDDDEEQATKQERQAELRKVTTKKIDEPDNLQNGISKIENDSQFPVPPPPPPQFIVNSNTIKSQKFQSQSTSSPESSIETPTPDYDSTPTHTLKRNGFKNGVLTSNLIKNGHQHCNNSNNIINDGIKNSTLGRVASNENAKANGDFAELESLESFKLQNSTTLSTIPKPPPLYFAPQSSGPPTMKKINRNIAVTIGEYGGGHNCRKEPSKLDFISKSNEMNGKTETDSNTNPINSNGTQQTVENFRNGIKSDRSSVSDKLRNELEKTLSRSNLKKRHDLNESNGTSPLLIKPLPLNVENGKLTNPIKSHHLSNNIEKLANMLQNKHRLYENEVFNQQNGNKSATIKSANKVTISIPSSEMTNGSKNQHQELRETESAPPGQQQTNGILKNYYGSKSNNFSEKSIKFGN